MPLHRRLAISDPSVAPAAKGSRLPLSLGGCVVAILVAALPAAASDFRLGEVAQIELANSTANRAHPLGAPLPSDPDGVWDCDNFAFMKYRILRDVLDWPAERLSLAWAQRGQEGRMVVLVHGEGGWAVLDHVDNDVRPLRVWEQDWRVEPLPYEPAASPSAPWVVRLRDTAVDVHAQRGHRAAD
jgi:hypothetical protein